MSPQFDEVLLTAYLDDEVTEEERARVVEELRTSEASRKLLEELRTVRNLVVQLQLAPPSRRFEHGPWNAAALPEANDAASSAITPSVFLNEAKWYRKMPLQRLASLAALIAIAVCVSVLLIGPNTKSISQSGSTKTDKSVDAKRLEKFGNNVELEVSEAENLPVLQPEEVDTATAMVRGRDEAKKEYADASLLGETKFQSQDALSTRSTGGKLQPQDSSRALGSDLQQRQAGKPANQAPATPSPAVSKPKPSSESFGLGNELAAADSRAYFSLQIVEGLDRSRTPKSNEFSKMFLYRLEANKVEQQEAQSLAEKTDVLEKEKQLLKSDSAALGKKSSSHVDGIEGDSILVEFQIPSENWELGTKRLRMLGMDIPEKLPTAEFLEFTATPNETKADSPIDQFVFDVKAARDTIATNWRFSAVLLQEKAKNRESETREKEPSSRDEKANQKRSNPPTIQIRVRPIK